MYSRDHRGNCCGINELQMISPGNLARGLAYMPVGCYSPRMQYRVHCPNDKRAWMEPELVAAGFTLLAINADETIWGKVG